MDLQRARNPSQRHTNTVSMRAKLDRSPVILDHGLGLLRHHDGPRRDGYFPPYKEGFRWVRGRLIPIHRRTLPHPLCVRRYAARFVDPALGFAVGWCYVQKSVHFRVSLRDLRNWETVGLTVHCIAYTDSSMPLVSRQVLDCVSRVLPLIALCSCVSFGGNVSRCGYLAPAAARAITDRRSDSQHRKQPRRCRHRCYLLD